MTRSLYIIPLILIVLGVCFAGYYFFSHKSAAMKTCKDITPAPRIVAFGDSLVAGYGATTHGGFVSLLSASIGVPITNLGRNGDTTAEGKERVSEVTNLHPNIVILLLGGNDALQQVPREETETNLDSIVSTLQSSGAKVILLGVLGGIPDPYAFMYSRIASKYKVTYVPNVLSGLIGNSNLMSDPVHPNEAGYAKIAARIAPIVTTECSK